MLKVRLHGRGGQGAVTAANILALAAYLEGYQVRANPFYGPERRGAPVAAFLRIDQKPIRIKSQIYQPDCIIVLDARLPQVINILEGLNPGGTIILNSSLLPEEVVQNKQVGKIITVDATRIAKELLGVAITNTAMVGAFARAYPMVTLRSVKDAIERTFSPGQQAEKNFKAAEAAYEKAQVKEFLGYRDGEGA
jgi:2-oxoacid:acceptor oxidoreductase gamma subunit (pyruvate/2-ketoisovalerate family)